MAILRPHVAKVIVSVGFLSLGGCLTLKADHDELSAEVAKLRQEVLAQSEQTGDTVEKAQRLVGELESKLSEIEEILRRNQADLGLRVDNLEFETQELRGEAENADFMATAASQELKEIRADLDERLKALEEKLHNATNIPENKGELWAEAQRQFDAKDYKAARRLWRTYESRYPGDEKTDEVKFQIGLTYYSERDYKAALGEYYKIIQNAPRSAVVPDALYYSGLAFAKLGQCENAIAYFDVLRQKSTKAPKSYKDKAGEQIELLKKNTGGLCTDSDSNTPPKT